MAGTPRSMEVDSADLIEGQAAAPPARTQSRAWSFSRRGRGKKIEKAEETSAPDGQAKVYFLDGSCKVFDVTSATILNFAQGSFALVERDVAALCAGDAAADGAARAALALAGVADAFCARRELVALKKACLHAAERAARLELELSRQASLFFRETTPLATRGDGTGERAAGGFAHGARY